jgi:hypothetical protein
MRRTLWFVVSVLTLAGLPGCVWDFRESVLQSIYHSYGEGYPTDRFAEFDERYQQQKRAAEDYYREHQLSSNTNSGLIYR